jgi:type IV pilus assembly protein PilY1
MGQRSFARHTCARILGTAALLLVFGGSASAQIVEDDLRLVAEQAGSPPNVVLLFDTSGSMQHIIWNEEFNPKIAYNADASCTNIAVDPLTGTENQCPGSGLSSNRCPNNENFETSGTTIRCRKNRFPSLCSGWGSFPDTAFKSESCSTDSTNIYFRIPNINFQQTWWAENYLNYILLYMRQNGQLPPLSNERRVDGGKRVLTELIQSVNPDLTSGTGYDERVRFGLARLDGNNVGGYIVQPIANGNRDAVIATLQGLPANGGTPIGEAFVDIARYFTGQLQTLGSYTQYNRTTTGGINLATAPPSPLDPSVLCRGNFVILITDGEPTSDGHNHALSAFTATFGSDYDQDGDTSIDTDSLDDVALYLFENDLIDDSIMPGKQNIVTYTIGYSLDTKLLQDTAVNGDGGYFTVTTAQALSDRLIATIDEIILRNASFTAAAVPTNHSSFGDGFYTAYFNPRPSGQLYEGHLQAYRIDENFDIVGSDGVSAIDPTTGEFVDPRTNYFWDAAEELLDPTFTRRLLYTADPATRVSRDFTIANVTAADLGVTSSDLTLYPNDPATPFATTEALADAIVSFVSGRDAFDRDRDGDLAELRNVVLGDVFHSNPQLVGQAQVFLSGEEGYGPIGDPAAFVELYSTRRNVLFAGANDGMLHAFNAGEYRAGDNAATPTITEQGYYTLGDGTERFGYVPNMLLDQLKQLPRTGAKPYYVDGQIVAADVWMPSGPTDTAKQGSEWTTVLITGMRNGERGYLALDVTNPEATTDTQPHGPYPKLMWELLGGTEPLGRSWSRAVITRVKLTGGFTEDHCGAPDGDGATTLTPLGNCRERWVAIFGGGYLEQGDPNIPQQFLTDPTNPQWENASKAIFVVALDTGEVLARASYDGADSVLDDMKFSFPSEPAVLDLDFDGFADVVYIGDTGGQLWKWDISATATVSGSTGRVSLTTWPIDRFFVSPIASNGHRRGFFYPPAASFVKGKLVLALGTGERTDLDYRTTAGIDENHFYVIRDDTPTGAGAMSGLPLGLSDITLLNGNAADPNPNDKGFYLVGQEDEKFVTDGLAFAGFVVTASYIPRQDGTASSTTSTSECAAQGDATLYIFSLEDGAGFFTGTSDPDAARRLVVGAGLPTSPSITVSGNMSRIVLQTSDGRVITADGPGVGGDTVELIYWRQDL